MKRHAKVARSIVPVSGGSAAAVGAAPAVQESVTLVNLQTAFHGETNAHARYLAFAKAADEEGFAPVASLFRAAASAEMIHARNHGEAIRGMGVEPKENIEAVVAGSTYDNLKAAIAGEIYEHDEMYPSFLHQARVEQNQAASRTFHFAQKAETEHAALFTVALQELDRLRGEDVVYYVCPVCGFTSAKAGDARCPICSNSAEHFER